MGTAEDFLSYFVMGNEGAKAYSMRGRINTDDNLYLEFSAPYSRGLAYLMGTNVYGLIKYRESILPYLVTPADRAAQARQKITWEKNMKAASLDDQAHVLNLAGRFDSPEYQKLTSELDAYYPTFAPWRFLRNEIPEEYGGKPRLLKQIELSLVNEKGEIIKVEFSAVILRRSDERAVLFFVDRNSHVVFGKLRVLGAKRDAYVAHFVDDLMKSVQALYSEEQKMTVASGKAYPSVTSLLPKIKYLVESKVDQEKM
jgi:spermidine synthase